MHPFKVSYKKRKYTGGIIPVDIPGRIGVDLGDELEMNNTYEERKTLDEQDAEFFVGSELCDKYSVVGTIFNEARR